MADNIRSAQYFKMTTPDKPGEGARMLAKFRDAGINLLAFSGFPQGRRGQLDFVPADAIAFKAAAKQAKLKVEGPKTCFLIEGDDRIGAGAELMAKLAGINVNVTALQAICAGPGRYAGILWVKPRDVRKAARTFGIAKP
jgi:predicted TIM-barrel fold metal-dependent hydrolase